MIKSDSRTYTAIWPFLGVFLSYFRVKNILYNRKECKIYGKWKYSRTIKKRS